MGNPVFVSNWDTVVLIVPFLVILAMFLLHLDERFASPKHAPKRRRSFCGVDPNDLPYVSDPDGKPWHPSGRRQIEGRLKPARNSGWKGSTC